jgi:hypothetical protein
MVWGKWNLRYFPPYNFCNLDISRELVFIEKYTTYITQTMANPYGGCGVGLARCAFCFSSSCRPCSALPNSSFIVVTHQSCQFRQLKEAILCLGVFLVTPQNLFSKYFPSVIVMFLFSVLFRYLCSYCIFFYCCKKWKTTQKRYSFCLMIEASDHGYVLHTRRIRGLLEKYPTFGREKETGLLGALDT